MKTEVKRLEDCKVVLKVEVDSDIWSEAQKRAFSKLAKNISIKGFRKGHVPESMARKYISDSQVVQQALEDVANPVYAQALQQERISPFTRPDVDVESLTDKTLTLVYKFTESPRVKLGAYTGLTAEKPGASVNEEEIEKDIQNRLEQAADLVSVERAAKLGDTVILDFKGFVDDKEFEGGSADNYELLLGSNSFVPGFEDALVGVKPGEEKDVNIVFPEQYVASLAGKPATFKCTLHEVKEKRVPSLSDEAVLDLNIADVKTVDELKEFVKKDLLQRKVNAIEQTYLNAIIDQIVDNAEITIPSMVVEKEGAAALDKLRHQIEDNGLTFQQYLEITGSTEAEQLENQKKEAERNLRHYFVIETLMAKEKIEASEEEIDLELARIGDQYHMDVEAVRKALGENLESIRSQIRNNKLTRFLLEKNPAKAAPKAEKPAAKKAPVKKAEAPKEEAKEEKKEAKPAAKKPAAKKAPAKKAAE